MIIYSEPRAKVRVFGHPITNGGYIVEDPLVSEFETTGGMIFGSDEYRDRGVEGACFFVFPLDYSGINSAFPRARYQHLMIEHNFNWKTRRGEIIHMPYGGRIEIEAI